MAVPAALEKRQYRSSDAGVFWERIVVFALAACALITVLVTLGIIMMLTSQSLSFFETTPIKMTISDSEDSLSPNQHKQCVDFLDGFRRRGGDSQFVIAYPPSGSPQSVAVTDILALARKADVPTDRVTVEPAIVQEGKEAPTWVTLSFGRTIGIAEFLTGGQWTALQASNLVKTEFGILPLLSGTFRVTLIAMIIALPLGLITAIYLSEFASQNIRSYLKPTLEIIAGIPTVVLGYFAILLISPGLQLFSGGAFDTFNATSAGIAVGILCLPMICSLSEDAMRAVPNSLREGAYGLGCTRFETAIKVVVPAALSGIISAFLLAFSRAVGETMVVALAAGTLPTLTADPTRPAQTMTGFIVEMIKSENEYGTVQYYSLYAVAITLFVITFAMTLLGQLIRQRFRESYQ